jgi:hypothetical protein
MSPTSPIRSYQLQPEAWVLVRSMGKRRQCYDRKGTRHPPDLYEADLGACYAILRKKLFPKAETNQAINPGQGHEAACLPYAEELKTDICRMSRKALR